jgi:tetratricopeptide (TPR) repeat protein
VRKFFQKESCFILGLFIFAFLVRFIYLNQIKSSPLFDAPQLDAKYHDQWAQMILKGWDFEKGVFFRAPLYPYFLALVYEIFGHSFYMARVVQFLIGSLGCVLIYLIGKKIFNPRVGKIAGIIASVYGILIYFEGDLLLESLSAFLNLLLILAMLWAKDKPSYGRWILCGGLMGLSAINRPNILLVAVAFFFWILFYFPQRPSHDSDFGESAKIKIQAYKKSLLYALCFTLGVILMISPVTIRNYVKGKDFVLIASQGGMNFFIGNNPQSDGASAWLPGARGTWWGMNEDATKMADEAMHRNLKPSQVSNFWYKQGVKFAKERPFAFLRLMLKKFALFWNGNEISNNKDIYFFAKRSGILKFLLWKFIIFFPFGVMCPLALLGMILSRKLLEKTILLLLLIFVYMTSVIMFFVTARYRVPILPFLIIFSAYTLNWFWVKIKEKGFSGIRKYLLILILISIPINFHMPEYQNLGVAWSHFNLGFAYSEKEDIPNAIKEYNLAITQDPNLADAYGNLGAIYRQQGKYTEALQEFEKALSHGADTATTLYNQGMIYYSFGLVDKAEEYYKSSLAIRDYDYLPHYLLGTVYMDKGMWEQAITEFESAIQYGPEFAPSYYELGLIYYRLGKKDQAISALENFLKLTEENPDQIKGAQRLLRELKTE